jgi:hypothetical protein
MRKIKNVHNPVYDEDGLIIFGEYYWEDADGQGWYLFGSIEDLRRGWLNNSLPRDFLDGLLKDAPTPLEKLMTENSTA